jgi:predicted GNAT family N-acyltransferase
VLTVRIADEADRPTCYRLRRVVFIDEQRVPEDEEWDGRDDACVHFLAHRDGEPVGTARLRTVDGHGKAERVAVLEEARGAGAGRAVMEALHDEARRQGLHRVVLAAQLTALPFYERLGYVAWGGVFDDAGIPHRWMGIDL